MPPAAQLRHATAGRARFKVVEKRGQAGYFSHVEQRLARLPGVRRVAANPRTGSVVIHHAMSTDELVAFAEREGLFRQVAPIQGDASVPQSFTDQLKRLDRMLRSATGEATDLRTLSGVALLALGLAQALRGNVAPPAATLLWYATTLLLTSPLESGAEPPAD